jgi:hypothetical protein
MGHRGWWHSKHVLGLACNVFVGKVRLERMNLSLNVLMHIDRMDITS